MRHADIIVIGSMTLAIACFFAGWLSGHWQYAAFGWAFLIIELIPPRWYEPQGDV